MPGKRSTGDARPRPSAKVASSAPERVPTWPLLVNGEQYTVAVDRASGFGEKYIPYAPLEAQDALLPQVAFLQREVEEIDASLRGERVIFEMKLLSNFFAGSYFPRELIRRADLDVVGSRSAPGRWVSAKGEEERLTRTLLVAGTDASIQQLHSLVAGEPAARNARVWDNLVRVDRMSLASPERIIRRAPTATSDGELLTWEAVFHPVPGGSTQSARRAQREILEKWSALVAELAGEVDIEDRRNVDGLTFLPVALTVESAYRAARFNPLRCMRPMAKIRPISVPTVRRGHEGYNPTPRAATSTPRGDARIAIFDGGVDVTCPFIAPFVEQYDRTWEPPDPDDVAHGTAVTTTALYGYLTDDGRVPRPDLGVDHYRVLPLPQVPRSGSAAQDVDRELYWLLDQIEEAVQDGDYTIVNLSIGPKLAVDEDSEPDRWTSTLDRLAREKHVLFVTAAGNDGDKPEEEGLHRVQVPADMVNGLGVGACTSRTGAVDRCAYSSKGPGRWGARIQPAGVAFGGKLPGAPYVGLLAHGELGIMEGTSLAAPLVTHGLSGLAVKVGTSDATPDLLRAFAIHFAERRTRGHRLTEIGYGRFRERYDDLWKGSPDEITVVYRDALRRDGVAGYQLPLPETLWGADSTVSIRWTVCVTAPVAAREPADYTLAGFDVTFRPHSQIFTFSDSVTRKSLGVANVETDKRAVREFLRAGGEKSKMPVTHSATRVGRSEHGRREAGWWETAVQARIVKMSLADLHSPSVELKYVAREGGALQSDADVLPFTMIVTVRTATPLDLYAEAVREFAKLEVAGAAIGVQTRVEI